MWQTVLMIGSVILLGGSIYLLLKRHVALYQQALRPVTGRLDMQERLLADQQTTLAQIANSLHEIAVNKQETLKGLDLLAEERHLLRTLIDALPDLIYIKDTQHRFVLANLALVHYLDLTSVDELIGKSDIQLFEPELAQRYYHDERTILETGQPLLERIEPGVDRRTKMTRWFLSTKVPFHDQRGELKGILGISRDITKRKAAEDALQELNQGLEQRLQRHV
jgi:PAS domain S-box-containing protein